MAIVDRPNEPSPTSDDCYGDDVVDHAYKGGWRLEITRSRFWLDRYGYQLRRAPSGESDAAEEQPVWLGGDGYHSVDEAKTAAVAAFNDALQRGAIKLYGPIT